MAEKHDPRHVDKRTADRYVRRGTLSQKEYDAYLKNLPDLESEADNIAPLVYGESEGEAPSDSADS